MNVERRGHASAGPEHEQARLSAHEGSPWGAPDPYRFFRGRQDDDGKPSPLAPLLVVAGIPIASSSGVLCSGRAGSCSGDRSRAFHSFEPAAGGSPSGSREIRCPAIILSSRFPRVAPREGEAWRRVAPRHGTDRAMPRHSTGNAHPSRFKVSTGEDAWMGCEASHQKRARILFRSKDRPASFHRIRRLSAYRSDVRPRRAGRPGPFLSSLRSISL